MIIDKLKQLFIGMRFFEISEYAILCLLAISIPIWWRLSIIFLLLLVINTTIKICLYRTVGNNYSKVINWSLVLLIVYYGLYSFSLVYSDNLKEGVDALVMKLPVLILPIFFLLSRLSYFDEKRLNVLKFGFVFSCFGIFIYCCIKSLYLGITENYTISRMMYWWSFVHHHTYDAMYYLLALVFLYDFIIKYWRKLNIYSKIGVIVVMSAMMLLVIFMGSRYGALLLGILVLIGVVSLINRGKDIKKKVMIGIGVVCVLIVLGVAFHKNYTRLFQTINDTITQERTDPRYEIWGNAIDIIKEHPVIGVGVGDRLIELDANHIKIYGEVENWNRVNPHNQFLDTWVTIGIVGVLILCMIFVLPIISVLKENPRNWVMVMFLLIVGGSAMVESILERQMGLIYFAFFYGILQITNRKDKNIELNN